LVCRQTPTCVSRSYKPFNPPLVIPWRHVWRASAAACRGPDRFLVTRRTDALTSFPSTLFGARVRARVRRRGSRGSFGPWRRSDPPALTCDRLFARVLPLAPPGPQRFMMSFPSTGCRKTYCGRPCCLLKPVVGESFDVVNCAGPPNPRRRAWRIAQPSGFHHMVASFGGVVRASFPARIQLCKAL